MASFPDEGSLESNTWYLIKTEKDELLEEEEKEEKALSEKARDGKWHMFFCVRDPTSEKLTLLEKEDFSTMVLPDMLPKDLATKDMEVLNNK